VSVRSTIRWQSKPGHANGRASSVHPSIWLIVPVLILLSCFCGVLIEAIMQSHRSYVERAGETAVSLIAAISSEISRNIEILDVSLQGIANDLKDPKLDHIDPELRQRVLFDRSTTARHLARILVIDAAGDLRIDSRTLSPGPLNLADRDYFQVHRADAHAGLYVGRPERARPSKEWHIGISRRLSNADGSIAGVVVANLHLSFLKDLFKDVALGPNGDVTLARTDGKLIMRWPYKEDYIGLDMSTSPLFARLAVSRSGIYEANSATDGLNRLVAYGQIGDLPLVVGIGQSIDHIYATWRRNTRLVVLLVNILCAMTVLLAVYLAREVGKRESAEKELVDLAVFDGLTGLFNRPYVDNMIDREWRRCTRARLPLALLLIDLDLFQPYNEKYGHEAGDALLKELGESIAATLKCGNDLAARYGGDEFAMLLPGASIRDAENVSWLLRQRFVDACSKTGIAPAGLSIGIAAAIAKAGDSPSGLVEAAERALQLAKERGRGRTEAARASSDELPRAA
jgi:diguanylate cyclase (GGDEF)-like protein